MKTFNHIVPARIDLSIGERIIQESFSERREGLDAAIYALMKCHAVYEGAIFYMSKSVLYRIVRTLTGWGEAQVVTDCRIQHKVIPLLSHHISPADLSVLISQDMPCC